MKKYEAPDDFFDQQDQWRNELNILRSILHETELEEVIKWNFPCYTLKNKNVVGIGAHKSYFGLWFFQGVFLNDPDKVLINAQEGKTKAMRQWRLHHKKDIDKKLIRNYLHEAIDNQKKGLEVAITSSIVTESQELLTAIKAVPQLFRKFKALSPGKQKEYHAFINSAKQDSTKQARIEKCKALIFNGIGLNDQYR
jgi:uncharacterized protein YdeI (YjbR/CyaY-like superfamily)